MLKIDPEFADQIPPLTEEEFKQLEANILSDGVVINPIIIWNGLIVDGHNRFRILEMHPEIRYSTFEKKFTDRSEVMAWICKNQLGRRNLSSIQRKYLMGKQYHEEKAAHGASDGFRGNQFTGGVTGKNVHLPNNAAERIAKENNTTERTVRRNEKIALGIEAAEKAVPGIRREILSGKICPVDSVVQAVAQAPPEEREALANHLRDPEVQRRGRKRPERDNDVIMRQILEDMDNPEGTVTEESMLDTLRGVASTMIRGCNRCFDMFPTLLTEQIYRKQVIDIMQEPKAYIMNLETGGTV